MVGDLGLGKAARHVLAAHDDRGHPSFVAPEQAQGERLDARADQYSLAALGHLLLTGPPASGRGLAAASQLRPASGRFGLGAPVP